MSELGEMHEEKPTPEGAENPFTSKTSIKNPLGRSGMQGAEIQDGKATKAREAGDLGLGEIVFSSETEEIAQEVVDILLDIQLGKTDPEATEFPVITHEIVLHCVLKKIGESPLCLGHGSFPIKVRDGISNLMSGALHDIRESKNISDRELMPFTFRIPEWHADHHGIDFLTGVSFMDITIAGPVDCEILTRAAFCKITFKDVVFGSAEIGDKSKKSDFVFESDMNARKSFVDAEGISIEINGTHSQGDIGPTAKSKIKCNKWEGGYYHHRGVPSEHSISPNVKSAKV